MNGTRRRTLPRRGVQGLWCAGRHTHAGAHAHRLAGRRDAGAGIRRGDAGPACCISTSLMRRARRAARDIRSRNGKSSHRIEGFAGGTGGTVAPQPGGPGSLAVKTTNLLPGYLRRNGVPYSADVLLTEYFDRLVFAERRGMAAAYDNHRRSRDARGTVRRQFAVQARTGRLELESHAVPRNVKRTVDSV